MNPRHGFLIGLAVLLCCTTATSGRAAVSISGTIGSDTTWMNTDTIIVTGNITVAPAGHLTIQPGAVILFNSLTQIFVDGQLTAQGEAADSILFTARADTAGGVPVAGSWKGVTFHFGSSGAMRHCVLRFADMCVYLDRAAPVFDSCLVENFSLDGMYVDGQAAATPITPVIRDCIFRQSQANLFGAAKGISVYRRADVTISGCEVSRCLFGLDFASSAAYIPHFVVTDCVIKDNAAYGVYTHAG